MHVAEQRAALLEILLIKLDSISNVLTTANVLNVLFSTILCVCEAKPSISKLLLYLGKRKGLSPSCSLLLCGLLLLAASFSLWTDEYVCITGTLALSPASIFCSSLFSPSVAEQKPCAMGQVSAPQNLRKT